VRIRQGVQAEVLLSLALITFTATALLLAIFHQTNHARIDALHPLLARGFVAETDSPRFELRGIQGGLRWSLDAEGHSRGLSSSIEVLDEETRALGQLALAAGRPHVQSGAPWDPIRFATPDFETGGVWVGRIDPPVSGAVLCALILVDVLVFGLFGSTLLRRRVVGPLRHLAAAVREIGDGDLPATVPTDGACEIAELGTAFNEMQTALAARTGALEKAVGDLRSANSRLRRAREGLDRAERLAMVGSLAAGVAHEVGNPMGALLAFLDMGARDPGLSEKAKHSLDRAAEQGERVRMILRQLLDFSRAPQVQHVAISLAEIAQQVVELVSAQRAYSEIEFEVVAERNLPPARGDRSLASQILLNLVLNAAAALEDRDNRRIRLDVRVGVAHDRDGDWQSEWAQRRVADCIVCWVEDSGPGVVLEDPERIFDPFFTTKAPGEGTGLGLANARRLAEEMGGRVELDPSGSSLGGARFGFVLSSCAMSSTDAGNDGTRARNQSRRP